MNTLEKNKNIIRKLIEELWLNKNIDRINEYYSTEFINHCLPSGYSQGFDNEKRLILAFHKAFTNFEFIIEDLLATEDKVILRGKWSGTHSGEWMGVQPTEKQVYVSEIAIYSLHDGKITELWANIDQWSLMKQLNT